MHPLSLLLSAALLAGYGDATAAAATRDTLGTAVVTAARPAAALTTTTPQQRLDSAALLRRGVTDMGDALRRLAGVTVRDYGGAGGLKSVSVRGLGAAHTAVTLDGLPLSEVRGGQSDLGRYVPEQWSSLTLEVADAADLLTPVRTLAAARVALQSALPDSGRHLSATLSGGSFTTLAPRLAASTAVGRHAAIGGSARFYFGENDYPFTLYNGVATTEERRRNSRMQTWQAELNAAGQQEGHRWNAKAYYYNNRRQLPGAVVLYTTDAHERMAEQQALAQGGWRYTRGALEVMAAAKYDRRDDHYRNRDAQYPGGLYREDYRQQEAYATAGAAYRRGALAAAYAVDLQWLHLATPQQAVTPQRWVTLQSLSLRYRQRRFQATGRLLLHLATDRRDAATDHTRRLTPSLTAAWTLYDRRRLRLMGRCHYQMLFRQPTFSEAYYYHLGSTTLRPETTQQVGLGLTALLRATAEWRPTVSLTVDAYGNRVAQRIVSIPYNLFIWQTTNRGQVRTTGVDATLDATLTPRHGHRVTLSGSYTLLDARDRTLRGSAGYGAQLAYTPRHSGSLAVGWENVLCLLTLHATFAGERWATNEHLATTRLAGYGELGLTLYREVTLRRHTRLSLRGDGLNLLDKQYALIRRYPMPGRAWRLTVGVKW
jgi:outer membrane cobalamin receptor